MSSNQVTTASAVTSLLIGASMWGVIWYPMRLLESHGLQGVWLTFIIYATALIASMPRTYGVWGEFKRSPLLLLTLMAAAGWTNVAFVEAVLEGNILRVLMLFYLSPLWATLMGWGFLRERISSAALISLFIAMSGALLMLWNPTLEMPWPQGRADWMAITSGFAFALSNVITRRAQQVSIAAKVFSVWSGVVIVAISIALLFSVPLPKIGLSVFSGAVALGLFGIMIMTVLVQYGVTHLPVHRSAVIALIELVAGAISQQILTEETVMLREWIGGGLIISGAYLVARSGAR